MTAECPTCGRDDFTSKRGMKQHHAKAHNESLGRETVTLSCDECGDSYEKREDLANESRFCSANCQAIGRETREKTRVESACEWCDKTYKHHPNRERRFCSRGCFHDWRVDYISGESSPLANKVVRKCDECGETFKRQESRATLNERDYCSRECYHTNYNGENAPNWKGGGVSYYGPNWLSQRRAALKRDDHECQDCGLTREQHHEKYGKDLEVHHKTPIRTFEDTSDANQLSNLITVCMNCHVERENRDD